jgi:hypothetical protein
MLPVAESARTFEDSIETRTESTSSRADNKRLEYVNEKVQLCNKKQVRDEYNSNSDGHEQQNKSDGQGT